MFLTLSMNLVFSVYNYISHSDWVLFPCLEFGWIWLSSQPSHTQLSCLKILIHSTSSWERVFRRSPPHVLQCLASCLFLNRWLAPWLGIEFWDYSLYSFKPCFVFWQRIIWQKSQSCFFCMNIYIKWNNFYQNLAWSCFLFCPLCDGLLWASI